MAHDQRIQWLRSTMPTNAVLIKERMPDEWFLALLERNPTNRPAFEHLMTLCLVAARPDLVARNIYRMDKFGYPRPYLPEHYAEAVVALMARTGAQPDLHGWQIRADTQRRFQECMEVARRYKGDSPAIERELWKRFPGSYFRYLLVGEKGRP